MARTLLAEKRSEGEAQMSSQRVVLSTLKSFVREPSVLDKIIDI